MILSHLSFRSVERLIRNTISGVSISKDAIRLMKLHLENVGKDLALHASRIHARENDMRKQIGERKKARLSPKHVKMAIDGKYPEREE